MGSITKGRDISLVLDAVLNQMPLDHATYHDLAQAFARIKSDIPYTAPELMYMRWELAMEALGMYVPLSDDIPQWKRTMADIFSSKLDYKDYL